MNSRPHKQSMSELKLRRLTEHNQRLREDLARPRIRVSEASASLIRYCKTTKDPLVRTNCHHPHSPASVPSVWGPVPRADDPYQSQGGTGKGCCVIQ
ncbi:G-protein gamma subunit [Lentinus tigrinus ALCF2SS1-7]|uniref:G-protein gamma subunit n=1 Tax=Lentinus tigrinus ALCF2SS1-7 TaxID=1328758 RepID=UPI00116614C6|nr:G-protein gamma subunit [Lentinus tigrinus ALCF2SS1-7]